MRIIKSIFFLSALFIFSNAFGQKSLVYVLELKGEVNPAMEHYMLAGIDSAEKAGAKLIVVDMNTYGGGIYACDSIMSALFYTPIPTAVFVNHNAASAGAFISIACDSIFMREGSTMGAATVVDGEKGEAASEKYQSYFRKKISSFAYSHGRDSLISEKMVDATRSIVGLSDSGKIITFMPSEAIKFGYCEGIKNNIFEVIEAMGIKDAKIVRYRSTPISAFVEFLLKPGVSSILILIIFWGIILEIKAPGFGFPGIAAIIAGLMFFAPHYIQGVADSWEIIIFVLGVLAVAAEIFIIPGFGVAGIAGIIMIVFGLVGAMVANNGFDFSGVDKMETLSSLTIVLVALVASIALAIFIGSRLIKIKRHNPIVDKTVQEKSHGYTSISKTMALMEGKQGIAITDLRPAGQIEIDGERYDAESDEGYIVKGTLVVVHRVKANYITVKKR